ncbi:MAG: DUF4347 domain-containing protein, partial [Magnetococcales bacterium]|nr:DUF4347 domain-containing protein [Magnetococcales bacterium]
MKLWSWFTNWLFNNDPQHGQATETTPARPNPTRARFPRLALRLERRLMFDAAGVVTALAALLHNQSQESSDHHNADSADHHDAVTPPVHDTAQPSPREVIVVDPSVPNYQNLLSGLPKDAQVIILDPHKDGVEQVRAALAGHSGIESLHIVSHGSSGYLALANSELDVVSMESRAQALQDWGAALSEKADILIYGCDVGAGMTGAAFVSRLATLTGADVAASNNLTGAEARGGDWVLEVQQGAIEAGVFLSAQSRAEYTGILPSTNPIISNLHGDVLPYAEGNGTVVIDQGGNATVTDPDSVNFNGGNLTVAISANRDPTQDVLGVRNQGAGAGQIGVAGANISYQGTLIGTYTGGSGTNDLQVTFNANATPTAVSALLRNITYTNTDNNNPTASTRSIAFTINDGSGGTSSAAVASSVVTDVNDAPTLTAGNTITYTENGAASVIDPTVTVADVDNTNMQSAVVQITANYQNGADQLLFTNTANITGSWNAATGTLTLTGSDTKANYQAALRSVQFQNTSNAPSTAPRSVSFQVNDGAVASTAASATVNVVAVNDAPTITAAGSTLGYTENDPGTVIDTSIVVADVDNANLQSAVIQIAANYQSGADQLLFTNTGSITGAWNAATGTLTLTGNDTKANYQAALRSVQYQNTSDAPTTLPRTVTYQVNDGLASSTLSSATVNVTPLNDAPVLLANTWYLPPVERTDTVNPAGTVVGSLFSAGDITDADPTPLQGIAIYNRTNAGVGSWQYSTNGGASWNNIPGGINSSNTFLLRSTDEIRFKPNNSNSGQPTLSFYAWDQSVSVIGNTPNANTRGGTTEFSLASGTIRGTVNAAPVLDNSSITHMTTITEDATTNAGQTVSAIVGARITDIDTAPVEGIAIQSLVSANGTWQYSTNAGGSWSNVGVVSSAQSLLLRPTDLLRFVPDGMNPPNNASPGTASITFVAWDQSGQSATFASGSKVSTVTRGTATPFSSNIETADITVTDLNDAPVLTPISPVLSGIRYLDTSNPGVTISSVVGASISDVDLVTAPLQGIAVNAINNGTGGGYWEFSTDNGTTWTSTGAVSNIQALLLRPQDKIRFQPGALNTSDNASFSYYAWDQTQNPGGQGSKVDVSTRGGTTAFSTASDTASIRVNVAPTLDPAATPALPTITEDQTTNTGATVASLLAGEADLDASASKGLALYGLTSGNGTWQYNTGSGWTNVGAVNATSALLLRDTDQLRFVPNAIKATTGTVSFYAWDQTTGIFGTKVDVSSRGGTTAFSTVANTATITATEVNDAPTLVSGGTLTFTEGGAATALHSTLTLSDVDDLNITGATIQITGNYVSSEDVLAFTNQSGITGSWNAATGTMTLTGTATKAQYQTALRSLTYRNTNVDKPSVSNRTVTWTITDGNSDASGGGVLTASATRTIAITAVNDVSVIGVTGGALAVTEGGAAMAVDPGLTLTDVDDANMTGATVQITTNYLSGEDVLVFTNQLGITGSWNAGTGKLTLTGTTTKANYQTALNSVTYQNTNSDNPSIATRTVTIKVTDANSGGEGAGALTATATRNITMSAVNDAPGVTTTAAPLSYTESGTVAVDAGLSLVDVDDTNMVGATVQITGNYLASEDILHFTNQAGITGSWNAVTGTLTLTGTASKASYQTALRSITYQNTNNDNPSIANRTVTFSVTDGNSNGQGIGALTTTATRDIVVQAVNDAPGVATTAAPLSYTESDAATVVDAGISLADVDDATIVGATVQITGNYLASEDSLQFTNQLGITGSWNAVTGTLTLTGTASKADYQTALRSITYQNTNNDNPSVANRTVTFSVTDGNS